MGMVGLRGSRGYNYYVFLNQHQQCGQGQICRARNRNFCDQESAGDQECNALSLPIRLHELYPGVAGLVTRVAAHPLRGPLLFQPPRNDASLKVGDHHRLFLKIYDSLAARLIDSRVPREGVGAGLLVELVDLT
jgi:hypothetical protein